MTVTSKLPGPKTPALVQWAQWINDPINFLENAAQRYDDIFITRLGWNMTPQVFVSNPKALQKIFTDNSSFQAPGSANQIFRPFLGDLSITRTLDLAHYWRKRKLLMPSFHGERVEAHGQLISNITEQAMSHVKLGKPFSALQIMQHIAQELILKGVLGIREGKRLEKLRQLLIDWLKVLSNPVGSTLLYIPFLQRDLGSWNPWGRLCQLNQEINQLLEAEIQERRQHYDPSGSDVLTLLVQARDEAGQPVPDAELRDDMLTLLAAGQESTASAMAIALHWIHRAPEVREKLLEDLESLNGSQNSSAISRLPYLNAVCQETLRMYPVAAWAFPRVVKKSVELKGYKLDPGIEVLPVIYLTHRNENLYPEPDQFKPERFLKKQFSPYEYLPFGGGSHICIGGALAMLEMKVVLATIISRYELELTSNQPLQVHVRRITLDPDGGVEMVATGQRQNQKSSFFAGAKA